MKKILIIVLSLAPLLLLAQFNPQPAKVTEQFFPDVDLIISTPAFQKRGGFTNHKEMMGFLNQKIVAYPEFISSGYIGVSQKGKLIPMFTLTNKAAENDKVRIWMQGGLHGDEPASTEGLLFLIDQFLEVDSLRSMLDHVVIQIVPMANVDGCDKVHRHAANGLDLNRDQTKLAAQESVFLKDAFNAFDPEVALDFHEFRPYRRDFARMGDWGVTTKYDVMFLYSGNLNVDEGLRKFTKTEFVAEAGRELDAHGLLHSDYFTSTKVHGEIQFNRGATSPRSSATSYALTNCVSTLVEVRGVALGRTSYQRRVFTTYTIARSYIESAINKKDELREAIANANATQSDQVVVKASRQRSGEEVPFIDLATNTYIALPVVVRDAWLSKPTLSRERPEAYLILPDNPVVVENLITLGLEVEELNAPEQMKVEAFKVVNYREDAFAYEGVHIQTVQTSIEYLDMTFPQGTIRVNSMQKNGNMLPELLEPEAVSSFVTFGLIKTELGSELPIYRLVKTKNP